MVANTNGFSVLTTILLLYSINYTDRIAYVHFAILIVTVTVVPTKIYAEKAQRSMLVSN